MSTYVYRNVEVSVPNVKKSVSFLNQVDIEKDNIKENDIVRAWCERNYHNYRLVDGQWVGIDSSEVPKKWILVEWYKDAEYSNIDEDECITFGDKKLVHLSEYCDNGGAIRDIYLGGWGNNYGLKDRGWPNDMSDSLKHRLNELENSSDGKYIHSKTYVTLEEWENLYERIKEEFKNKVAKSVRKEEFTKIDQRLDYLEGILLKKPDNERKWEKKDNTDDYEDDSYYDSIDYLFNEDFYELTSILGEINKAYTIQDTIFGWNDYSNIRIVYYMG